MLATPLPTQITCSGVAEVTTFRVYDCHDTSRAWNMFGIFSPSLYSATMLASTSQIPSAFKSFSNLILFSNLCCGGVCPKMGPKSWVDEIGLLQLKKIFQN